MHYKMKEHLTASEELTDGNTTVRATEVYVALRDGGHPELVIGSGEECGEGAGEHYVTVPDSTTDCHAHLQDRGGRDSSNGNGLGRHKEHYNSLLILLGF